jgi:DNA-binding XRE family transcriptional regulator
MNEPQRPVTEDKETVTLLRADYEALLTELEEAEDRIAVMEHMAAVRAHKAAEPLTLAEADRLMDGANPITVWREKRGMTQRALAASAEISPALLSEIENGIKTGSVETLRKLAHALKVEVDALLP